MKFILWAIILAFLALTFTNCSLPPDKIASRLEPSLVKVFYKNQPGHGTGFFVPGETGVCKVLTAAHVVNKEGETLLQTKDGKVWDAASVEMFSDDIDLALVTFEPEKEKCDYPTLKIGNSEDIKQGSSIYISGLSSRDGKMLSQFVKGNVTALNVFPQGYRVSYQGLTVAGMSGAPVIDERGKVVAVHGMSDVETVKGFSSLKTSWPELELQTTWQAEEVVNTAIKHLTFSWGIPISFFRESPFYYDSGDIYGLSWWIFLSGAGIVAVSFIYVGFRYLNVSPLIAEVNNLKTQLRDEEDKGEEVQKELKSLKNSYKGLERKLEAEISERYEAEEQIQTLQVVVEKQKQLEMQLEIEMSTRCQVEEQIQTLQVAAQKERELERQLEFESQNTEDKSGVDLFLVSEAVKRSIRCAGPSPVFYDHHGAAFCAPNFSSQTPLELQQADSAGGSVHRAGCVWLGDRSKVDDRQRWLVFGETHQAGGNHQGGLDQTVCGRVLCLMNGCRYYEGLSLLFSE